MSGRRRIAFVLVAILAGSGCLPARPVPAAGVQSPTAAMEWPAARAQAMAEARASRLPSADKALTDFAQRFPGSREAAEVTYWRALLRMDPNNSTALRESLTLLESYLANTPSGMHRTEATTLRRLGVALEERNAALAAIPPAVVPRPDDKTREEELQRLRDELAAANAELERVRRRVARPPRP